MKRNHLSKLTGLSAALLFSTATLAAGQQGADFQKLDKNNDGKLTASEISQQDELRAQWAEIDQDNNGAIDREEFSAFEEEQQGSGVMARQGEDFQSLDRNQDGELSPSEASRKRELSQQWTEIDQDNSGTIDREEFSAFEEMNSQKESSSEGMEREMESNMEREKEQKMEREMREETHEEKERGESRY